MTLITKTHTTDEALAALDSLTERVSEVLRALQIRNCHWHELVVLRRYVEQNREPEMSGRVAVKEAR